MQARPLVGVTTYHREIEERIDRGLVHPGLWQLLRSRYL